MTSEPGKPKRPTVAQVCAFVDMMRANHRRLPPERLRRWTDQWLERSFPGARLRASVQRTGKEEITVALIEC